MLQNVVKDREETVKLSLPSQTPKQRSGPGHGERALGAAVCARDGMLMIKQPPQICYSFDYTQNGETQFRHHLT